MSDFSFSRDDLLLLMQSYENTIKLNTTLLEQQKRVIEDQTKILEKMVNLTNITDTIADKQKELIDEVDDKVRELQTKVNDIQTSISENRIESIKGHGTTKNRLIFVYAGLTSIFVSLISLVYSSYSNFPRIIEILTSIKRHLGIE